VNQSVRQYLVELERQNPIEEPVHQQEQARLGHYDNYLVDNSS